jgi:hypothetical protein
MIPFTKYLTEAAASEEKLLHLEHNEDHAIHGGVEGFNHAVNNLNALHDTLTGKDAGIDLQVKHDGSPAVIFGRHPENGKFFVASKSGFNATPKINYSHEDIERNHGHAPGLVAKLKAAFDHLPKVAPEKGVYQGDLMYTRTHPDDDDVKEHGGKYHFTPNTITYSTPTDSEEGKKISGAKLGVLIHTQYEGSKFADMKANFTPDKSVFKNHKDVHQFDNSQDLENTTYTPEQQAEFQKHMDAAHEAYRNSSANAFDHVLPHEEHMKTYINQTIRNEEEPSVEGYKEHLRSKYQKKIDKLKTDKAMNTQREELASHHAHIDQNIGSFEDALNIHKHLKAAKQPLIDALASHQRYEHSIAGSKSKPEGYVVVRNGRPTKMVDREDFSRNNFARSANR